MGGGFGQALKGGVREKAEVATKFGIVYDDGMSEARGDPAYVRAACEGSLKRLEIDCIDLYYQHRIDTRLPIEVTVCALCSPFCFFFLKQQNFRPFLFPFLSIYLSDLCFFT